MWQYNNAEELYHSGVLGMHWGRKKRVSSNDHITARQLEKKKMHELSNNELRDLNNRQSLEANHKRSNPNHIKKGWLIVGATLGIMKTLVELKNNTPQVINMGKSLVDNIRKSPETLSKVGPAISKIRKTPFFIK